jgi:acetyl-CoA acetyltransferase
MRDVYIIGMGFSPWLGFSEQVFTNFGTVAIDKALKEADIEWKRIQAIMAGIFVWGGNAGHLAGQYQESIFGETGVPVINVYNACATGTAIWRRCIAQRLFCRQNRRSCSG